MTDMTYNPRADALYITVGRGKVDRTEETGQFIYDVDTEGLSASKVLAPADWKMQARPERARVGAAGFGTPWVAH
jgi:uncharacterized protein YuzE